MKQHVTTIVLGGVFGFCLSRIGFSSWDEVHAMFTFGDLRLTIAFAIAVVLLTVSWLAIRRLRPGDPEFAPRPIHKGTLAGGVTFGVGWALTGACPSIALVQLGEGKLGAAVTLVGIFLGNALYAAVHERFFRFSVGSCEG